MRRRKGFSFSGQEGDLIETMVPFVSGEVDEFCQADRSEATLMLATEVLKKKSLPAPTRGENGAVI
jgi:hypothetical protein